MIKTVELSFSRKPNKDLIMAEFEAPKIGFPCTATARHEAVSQCHSEATAEESLTYKYSQKQDFSRSLSRT